MAVPGQFSLYIVRHGETEWNKTRRVQGHLDIPLNQTGLKQAMLVGEALKDIRFTRAFSSDLQRASKTAECILQYHPYVALERDELIRERCMGELQGEIARSSKPAPSVETMPNFTARCLTWYKKSIVGYMNSTLQAGPSMEEPHNILVVSHGAWIAVLLSALQENGLVTCRRGVHIGRCLNTGISTVEYTMIPVKNVEVLKGTLVQYSGVEHLKHKNLHVQEVNADVLEERGRRRQI